MASSRWLVGRDPRNIKFLAGASVIVGKTDDVARKVDEFTRLRSVDGYLAHSGAGLDWTKYAAPDPRRRDHRAQGSRLSAAPVRIGEPAVGLATVDPHLLWQRVLKGAGESRRG